MFDLVAGAKQRLTSLTTEAHAARPPRVLVFDSGLGGLTVYTEVQGIASGADFTYLADDAVFPYGALPEGELVHRVMAVMEAAIEAHRPDVVVVACNTASTSVLPPLRARWPAIAFVGTVPAIKPAVAASRTRQISVLATAGTVKRDYTRHLIETYAGGCHVTLVGSAGLARLAEAVMRGEAVSDIDILEEIAPAFVIEEGRRTDVIVLACTHYPLLLPRLQALAPWDVTWIDPAPAIARRVGTVLEDMWGAGSAAIEKGAVGLAPALFTGNKPPGAALEAFLARCGLQWQASPALAALTAAEPVA